MIESTRDLLAGGDLTTIVSQPAHQLIEYLVLWLLIMEQRKKQSIYSHKPPWTYGGAVSGSDGKILHRKAIEALLPSSCGIAFGFNKKQR
jgi:hypothetical protein